MAVPVKMRAGGNLQFQAGAPLPLFDAHMAHDQYDAFYEYDVTADGKRFLINTTVAPKGGYAPDSLAVIVNWTAGLKK